MRLSKEEIQIIRSILLDFCPKGKIYLHGSRIDDTKKGGDIDLFFIVPDSELKRTQDKKLELSAELSISLNEQKVDVIYLCESQSQKHEFYQNSNKIIL